MRIATYLSALTGLTPTELFVGPPQLVVPVDHGDGVVTIAAWDVPGVARPSDAEIAEALDEPEPPPPPPPAPTSCTRLGLMRAFTEMGLWAQVKAFIAGDETRQEQWDLATELKLSDPIMVDAIEAFALSGIPIDPVQLATRANALVA